MFVSDAFSEDRGTKAASYPSYNSKEMFLAVWEEPLNSSVYRWVHVLRAALSVPGSREQSVPAGSNIQAKIESHFPHNYAVH